MRQFFFFISIFTLSLFFSACSTKASFINQDTLQAEGRYSEAIRYANEKIDHGDTTARDNLLWKLYLGQSQFFDNKLSASISSFDEAENLMKVHREKILAVDLAKDIGSTLTNDNARPYIGNTYDGIMLNTYKALAYMQQKNYSAARVELNRAIDRQRRAKEFFTSSIAKETEAIKKEQAGTQASTGTTQETQDRTIQEVIQAQYPELNAYKVYPDFINPMTNYLAALFALANDDKAKGEFLLKESRAMLPASKTIEDDFQHLSQTHREDTVWLIYEEGLAPVLHEMRIDFPAWIFTSEVNYVSLALPRIYERPGAFEYLSLRHEDQNITKTELLSSMERVIQTEFKKHYPSIVKRSVISAISKALMQRVANDSNNNIAAFVTTVYGILSTQADTRMWTSLPKNFHVAKFNKEGRNSIDIYSPFNHKIASVKLAPAKHTLIYVKIPTMAHKVHISSFSLGVE